MSNIEGKIRIVSNSRNMNQVWIKAETIITKFFVASEIDWRELGVSSSPEDRSRYNGKHYKASLLSSVRY